MIVVGSTLAAYVMNDEDTWGAWLRSAEAMAEATEEEIRFFVAIEVDRRGLQPFEPLLKRLTEIEGNTRAGVLVDWWTYDLDDRRTSVTTANRLRHLTMGQNLVSEYATAEGASHLLFMAADTMPPADAIPKLLEMDLPLVGGHVSTYAFGGEVQYVHVIEGFGSRGPTQRKYREENDQAVEGIPVLIHFPTAAFVMIERDLFKAIRWRVDVELGMTDDPSYAYDAEVFFGVTPCIRLDCVGRHFPEAIGPIESRGHDMTVHR